MRSHKVGQEKKLSVNINLFFSFCTEISNLKWNLKLTLKFLFVRCNSITFQLGAVLWYSLLIQEHCKLIIFDDISTFFKPPFT